VIGVNIMNYVLDKIRVTIQGKKNSWEHFKDQMIWLETHRPDDSRLPETKRRFQQLEIDLAILKEEYPEYFL